MNRIGAAKDEKDALSQDEERAGRVVRAVSIARCVIGPLVLFGLLLGTAYWEPTDATAQAVHAPSHVAYFAAGDANAAGAVEEHVQAF